MDLGVLPTIRSAYHAGQLACLVASGKISGFAGKTSLGEHVLIKRGTNEDGGNIVCLQAGDDEAEFLIVKGSDFRRDPQFRSFTVRNYELSQGN